MHKRKIFLFLLIFLSAVVFAEDAVRIEQSADKNKITIGERINYDIKLKMPEGFSLKEPEKTENLGEWSVKGINVYKEKKDLSDHIVYNLTAYTTGEILIPEIIIKYFDDKQKENQLKTQSFKITIESVIAKIKGQPALRDVAPVMNLEVPLSVYLIWISIIALILGGAGIGYYFYIKRLSKNIPINLPPPIPPEFIAQEALERLKNSSLIKDGKIKEFYISLIDIIRDFLSGTYGIDTRDRTTGEIFYELKRKEHDKKKLGFIREFLEEGDLVKFAKYRPNEKACWEDFDSAKRIVTGNPEPGTSNQ